MSTGEPTDGLSLRAIGPADAPACHGLSRAVGWPHRLEDVEMAIALGRGVAIVEGERIVACALWWPFGEAHASLGMIIVSPDQQGRGLGKRLMRGLIAQTGTRALVLTATAAGEPLYRRVGFTTRGEIQQWHRVAPAAGSSGAPPVTRPGDSLRPASLDDLAALERLDRQATGLPRGFVLAELLARGEAVLLEREGEVAGYAILRPFGRGAAIGPVVAPGVNEAESLVDWWLHHRPGPLTRIDVPADCGLGSRLGATGWQQVGSGLTMARGALPETPGPARGFALVSQAIR